MRQKKQYYKNNVDLSISVVSPIETPRPPMLDPFYELQKISSDEKKILNSIMMGQLKAPRGQTANIENNMKVFAFAFPFSGLIVEMDYWRNGAENGNGNTNVHDFYSF